MNNNQIICDRIDELAGSLPQGVSLLLATKTIPQEVLEKLAQRYPFCFGENRQQEMTDKWFGDPSRWHFIGRLQRNKVKYLVDKVCVIESVDSVELAEEIERQCAKHGVTMTVLVEVNLGEAQKGGVEIERLPELLDKITQMPHLMLDGLMVVLPKEDAQSKARQAKALFDRYQDKYSLRTLSMGMSEDYKVAIECGSTEIRIGSLVFGQRS